MKSVLALVAAIALSGCSVFTTKTPVVQHAEVNIVVDNKLLELCAVLPNRSGTSSESIAEHHIEVITAYGVCAEKQKASVASIRKLANIKD